jgi:hypothetical protein
VPLSVRLDPVLEARLEQEARRRRVTKSEVVIDALERVLGLRNPDRLLDQVCSYSPGPDPTASERTGEKVRARLRAKRPR